MTSPASSSTVNSREFDLFAVVLRPLQNFKVQNAKGIQVKIPSIYIRAIRASRALPSLRRPWLARPAHTHKWLRKSIQFTLKSIPSSPQTFQRQSIRESPKIQKKSKSPKIILSMSLGYFCTLAVKLELELTDAIVRPQSLDN